MQYFFLLFMFRSNHATFSIVSLSLFSSSSDNCTQHLVPTLERAHTHYFLCVSYPNTATNSSSSSAFKTKETQYNIFFHNLKHITNFISRRAAVPSHYVYRYVLLLNIIFFSLYVFKSITHILLFTLSPHTYTYK